ncbi:hypothetical protein WJX81_002639 [Elliptochloris bilobata]|uniref:methenyltetrahydrofolate cyclohydrolase n=1 Tax=Elliptochloris bilobata TaxID=381761 RepID=A0AAW1RN37_9CHLO
MCQGLLARSLTGRGAPLDGLGPAAAWTTELAAEADSLRRALGRPPGLAIVLVGNRLDSQLYVQRKLEACAKVGIRASVDRLPAAVGQADLEARVRALCSAAAVDGLIVQLPLPPHINAAVVLSALEPAKDVDGYHPLNLGQLLLQAPGSMFVPCAALGCLELLKRSGVDVRGKTAAVLGDSSTVGLPIALALRSSGVGTLTLVVGDVNFASVSQVAGAITPVPGGVGPMTVAAVLHNTLQTARLRLAAC